MRLGTFDVGFAVRAADGFAMSGDAAVTRTVHGRILLAVIDALGHGPDAHRVAQRCEDLLESADRADALDLFAQLDRSLTGTIGAAVGIAVIEPELGRGQFVGVGNTVARSVGGADRKLVSVDGVVGQRHPTVRPVEFTIEPGELLLMHSDGISSRFTSADMPELRSGEPLDSAREIIRRFARGYDDAACIVARRPA